LNDLLKHWCEAQQAKANPNHFILKIGWDFFEKISQIRNISQKNNYFCRQKTENYAN